MYCCFLFANVIEYYCLLVNYTKEYSSKRLKSSNKTLKQFDFSKQPAFVTWIRKHPADYSQQNIFSDDTHFEISTHVDEIVVFGPWKSTNNFWKSLYIVYFFEKPVAEDVTVNDFCYCQRKSSFKWAVLHLFGNQAIQLFKANLMIDLFHDTVVLLAFKITWFESVTRIADKTFQSSWTCNILL